jgi:hypothetical protein
MVKLEDERINFRDEDGQAFVVRCPKCHLENHACYVATGECAWCGWSDEENSSLVTA